MAYISFGIIERKLIIYFLLYIITLAIDEICYNFRDEDDKNLNNIPIKFLVDFGGSIFYAIPSYIISRHNKKLILKYKNNEIFDDSSNVKLNVYKGNIHAYTLKNIIHVISAFIIYYLFNMCQYYRPKKFKEYYPLIFNEFFDPLAIVFLYLIFRVIRKTIFYKHQNFSFIIILISGIINYILIIFFGDNEIDFSFIAFLIIIILVLLYPFLYSVILYVAKEYMKYKYYSPFFLSFIVGLVFSIISLSFLFICYNIDYDKSDTCQIIDYTPKFLVILFIRIIIYAVNFLLKILILNNFSCIHLIIFYLFRGIIYAIERFFRESYINHAIGVINLIIKILQFIFGLIFLEIIELNFFGFNKNLRKYITNRSKEESEKIYELYPEESYEENNDDSKNISLNDSGTPNIY